MASTCAELSSIFSQKKYLYFLWIGALLITTLLYFYVLISFIKYKHPLYRKQPAKLLLFRTSCDFMFAMIFFAMILMDTKMICRNCSWLSPTLIAMFLLGETYFGYICYDMYRVLVNPFKQPVTNSVVLHLSCWIVTGIIVAIASIHPINSWSYRSDFKICLIENTEKKVNWINAVLLYIPALCVNVFGIFTTCWAYAKQN